MLYLKMLWLSNVVVVQLQWF